ncbi:MAG: gamma-glutamylcyclotransferase family protein [Pseudomonadota bacterium]
MTTHPVFVYGTLRPGAHNNRAAQRLLREAKPLGPAWLQARLYRIHWFPGVILSDDPTDQVRGDLFALPARGNLLTALDVFERYDPKRPKRGDFRRDLHQVLTETGAAKAWVYTYHGPISQSARVLSGDFLAR